MSRNNLGRLVPVFNTQWRSLRKAGAGSRLPSVAIRRCTDLFRFSGSTRLLRLSVHKTLAIMGERA